MTDRTRDRRAFLVDGALVLAATATLDASELLAAEPQPVRFGVVTDLHFADKPAAGTRHYRRTPEKLAEAEARFARTELAFVVELGDLIDAADSVAAEKQWLRTIDRQFAGIAKDRHYVLGNHCVQTLTKPEFLEVVERERSYYSFDRGGVHFVVLDSCFRGDGVAYGRGNFKWTDPNVPAVEPSGSRRT